MTSSAETVNVQRKSLRLAFFYSTEESEKACSLFSEDEELKNTPWDISPAPLSLITTEEGISLLKKRNVKIFQVREPIAEEDITRQQRKFLQTERAVWAHSHFLGLVEVTFFLERVHIVMKRGKLYVKKEKP